MTFFYNVCVRTLVEKYLYTGSAHVVHINNIIVHYHVSDQHRTQTM